MAPLLLLTVQLLALSDSVHAPRRVAPATIQPTPVVFEASRCLLGFCPSPDRSGLPPGVMFLATGLVAVGVAGLVQRGDKRAS